MFAATWLTGSAFEQGLNQPVDIVWTNVPLRQAVKSLAESQKIAILLDRRIDPGQKLNLSLRNAPMRTVLNAISQKCGLGISQLGSVVYLGPADSAERLRAVAGEVKEDVRRLPATMQRKFLGSKPMVWKDFAVPRDLLAQLGKQNGINIVGLDRIPHDLWAGADLPALSLVDRLTLVAFQFDQTCRILDGGRRIELIPIADK